MSSFEDRIKEVEDEIRRTQKNKATESHIGKLKAKIARLKREQQERVMGGGASGGDGYDVKKSGDSSVAFIGFPSVGKSTLLNALIGRELSQVGSYAFTTLDAIPGAMYYEGATIQLIDLPGIISGASSGKGRGKRVLGVARSADLLLVILDVMEAEKHLPLIMDELFYVGIRINSEKPDIVITKTMRGGVGISSLKRLTHITEKTIKGIMQEYRMMNADITIRSDITVEQLIDSLEGNRVYIPALFVINKIDLATDKMIKRVKELVPNPILISASGNVNIDGLREAIYTSLDLIKLYLKPQGGETDFEEPLIVRDGSTVGEICDKLHRNFRNEFKFARVWGSSVKHDGQKVGLTHILADEDVLTIIRSTR